MRPISNVWSFEDLLHMSLRLDAHVLLTQRLRMLLDVCILLDAMVSKVHPDNSHSGERWQATYELFRQGNLLKLHLVDSG